MKHNSIVISGLPGAGKGTISKEIAQRHNWDYISLGNFWREKWKKEFPAQEVTFEKYWNDLSFEEQKSADLFARKKVAEGNIVGDFRFAKSCEGLNCLFVFLKADLEKRAAWADKTGKYPGKSVEEIKEILQRREEQEVEWGKKIYGEDYDFRNEGLYDLVIDSSKLTIEQEAEAIEKANQ